MLFNSYIPVNSIDGLCLALQDLIFGLWMSKKQLLLIILLFTSIFVYVSYDLNFFQSTHNFNFFQSIKPTDTIISNLKIIESTDWLSVEVNVSAPPVTIVTALFNIGTFQKGTTIRTVDEYLTWMHIWQKIKNRVVFGTNKIDHQKAFIDLRTKNYFPTQTILIDTDNSDNQTDYVPPIWSLSLLSNLTELFKRPDYPKHHPNTVLPMYSAVMGAKYDLLEQAILTDQFDTEYFAWIDFGLFRNYPRNAPCFRLVPPPNYVQDRVAMSLAFNISNRSTEDIIKGNHVWVSGAGVFGHKNAFIKFINQYRKTTERMIAMGWYSTDQQTIYSMFADYQGLGIKLDVQMQLYSIEYDKNIDLGGYEIESWFYLGYIMRKTDEC